MSAYSRDRTVPPSVHRNAAGLQKPLRGRGMTRGNSPKRAHEQLAPLPQQRVERRVVRAVGFVPFETKLQEPLPREGLVFRGELVDRLRESADDPVVLMTAPPGYGKTTLVRQWAEEDPRPFAWLSLD